MKLNTQSCSDVLHKTFPMVWLGKDCINTFFCFQKMLHHVSILRRISDVYFPHNKGFWDKCMWTHYLSVLCNRHSYIAEVHLCHKKWFEKKKGDAIYIPGLNFICIADRTTSCTAILSTMNQISSSCLNGYGSTNANFSVDYLRKPIVLPSSHTNWIYISAVNELKLILHCADCNFLLCIF